MNMYSLPGYFIGKTMPELPIMAALPMLFCLIIYWMVNLNDSTAKIFFEFYLICLMQSLNGNSLGLAAGSAVKDEKTAMAVVPIFILPFMLFGGFYNNRSTFASWIGWIEYLSPFKYGFEGKISFFYKF
jgi:ABC-type multidrug transport system permease subunit